MIKLSPRSKLFRYYVVSHDKVCDHCGEGIFNSVFYYFPCGHSFHEHCLKDMMKNSGEEEKLVQIQEIEKHLAVL